MRSCSCKTEFKNALLISQNAELNGHLIEFKLNNKSKFTLVFWINFGPFWFD